MEFQGRTGKVIRLTTESWLCRPAQRFPTQFALAHHPRSNRRFQAVWSRRRYPHRVNEKPTDLVAAWLAAHKGEFGSEPFEVLPREGTLVVRFETPVYFIEFLVWDFGCLDIHAVNKSTGAYDYTVGGYFDGVARLTQRLDTFLAWFTSRNAP